MTQPALRWYVNRAESDCSDYVAFREFFQNFLAHPFIGNAKDWNDEADGTNGWRSSSTPHLGDIAWWWNEDLTDPGHVAVVTTISSNGSVAVEEVDENADGTDGVRVGVTAQAYLQRYP